MADTLHCTIVTPERQALDEEVVYVSLPAWDGLQGIAPLRAPILVKLGDGVLRVDLPGGQSRSFFIAGGFAQMKDNWLSILTSEAITPDEVNRQDIQASLKEAEARQASTTEEVEQRSRQINRARALLSLGQQPARR
ncbi:MAG: ATP synthase F1 subunit epsilon [Phycisphaeraceae bacterium]